MKSGQDLLNDVLNKLIRKREKRRISGIDITSDTSAIRMNIGRKRYRIAHLTYREPYSYMVERVGKGVLISDKDSWKIENKLNA